MPEPSSVPPNTISFTEPAVSFTVLFVFETVSLIFSSEVFPHENIVKMKQETRKL
tara:strand:- start:202 stop:366 length:165 start_codon:yes stop_codon:yes gene_type:complete